MIIIIARCQESKNINCASDEEFYNLIKDFTGMFDI